MCLDALCSAWMFCRNFCKVYDLIFHYCMKCKSYYTLIFFVDILKPHKEPFAQPSIATQNRYNTKVAHGSCKPFPRVSLPVRSFQNITLQFSELSSQSYWDICPFVMTNPILVVAGQ